jgi:hypothetical protein
MKMWIEKKFSSKTKISLRESIFPGIKWHYVFVCARLKDEREKDHITEARIKIIPFGEVLAFLIRKVKKGEFTTSSGGDLVEVMRYLTECELDAGINSVTSLRDSTA